MEDQIAIPVLNERNTTPTRIDSELVYRFVNSEGEEKEKAKEEILLILFSGIEEPPAEELVLKSDLEVIFGSLTGPDAKDAVFIIRFSSQNNPVLVYSERGGVFYFVDVVDNFFEIVNVHIDPVGEKGRSVLMIHELVNQSLGAFEEYTSFQGFFFNNITKNFQKVIDITETLLSYWNQLWKDEKGLESRKWFSLVEQAKLFPENGSYNKFYFYTDQRYKVAPWDASAMIPGEDQFNILSKRQLSLIYYWSDNWEGYLLYEGIELATGLRVAVLGNMSYSIDSIVREDNRYIIKRSDGIIAYTDKDQIKVI